MGKPGSIFERLRSLFVPDERKLPGSGPVAQAAIPKVAAVSTAPVEPLNTASKQSTTQAAAPLSSPAHVAAPVVTSQNEVDIVIGIDFGTSCTKVVIGDAGWLGCSYVVPIGDNGDGIAKFLRTTKLNSEGRTELNLKMRLMENPAADEARVLAALYLAGVIRDALEWFSVNGPRRYKDCRPVWSVNLGFPGKCANNGVLATSYREVGVLAARLGSSNLPITYDALASVSNRSSAEVGEGVISSRRVSLYPEIAAQLASYVNSPFRAPGNLILLDVGAGTLDVSTAILHGSQEDDVISFHCCEVGPYGAAKLLQSRIAALQEINPRSVQIRSEDFQSGTEPMPDSVTQFFGGIGHVSREAIEAFESVSKAFATDAVNIALRCAARFRKRQRDGHANSSYDPWPGYLRFFFTGGGSRLRFYRHYFVGGHFEQELAIFTRWKRSGEERRVHQQGLRLEQLPVPDDLEGLPAELNIDFDRLSVAHGLAYGRENLMKITAQGES